MNSTFVSQTSWSENAKNTPKIEKSIHSNSCISITRGSIYSTEGRNRKAPTFGGFLGSKTINPDTALKSWNPNRQKFLQSHNLDSTRLSNSVFSENTALSSFFKVPIFNFLLLLHFCTRKCCFSSIQSNSEWPELTESAVGLEKPRKSISYFLSSISFKFSLTNQSKTFQMKQTAHF